VTPGAVLHLLLGLAAGPLLGWALLRRAAGAVWGGPGVLLDLAPPALLWIGLLGATSRPLLAGVVVLGACVFLAVADHAKRRVLEEPLVFSDGGLFAGVLRHPQLYLPFVGLPVALGGVALGVAGFLLMLWVEPALPLGPVTRIALLGGSAAAAWPLLVRPDWFARTLAPTRDPAADAWRLGLLATLGLHRAIAAGERTARQARVPPAPAVLRGDGPAPHVVLVQAESFFDARRLGWPVPEDLLPNWDALGARALRRGRLAVPGFGANTMRTEFAVLSGVPDATLGLDRLNPYFRFARKPVASLAWAMRGVGYGTACLHPFDRRFFGRDLAIPALGFERFLDEAAFDSAPRAGRYVSDAAVGERVLAELRGASGPQFLFAITMQAHGPWPGQDPLAAYLAHLRATDAMLGALAAAAESLDHPLLLAVYGDHLPALERQPPEGRETDYLIWRSDRPGTGERRNISAVALHQAIRAAVPVA
jgi:hypothetical protein